MTDTVARYHKVAILLHWLIGLFIIANLALGLLLDDIPDDNKFLAFTIHKSLGLSVLVLTLVRIYWRLTHKAPDYPASFAGWELKVAKVTHFILYVLMLGIPLSGWLLVSASPRNIPTNFFGLFIWPQIPGMQGFADQKATAESIGDVHSLLAYAMLVLLFLHIAAALRHKFILKDSLVERMLPGKG